MVRGCGIADRAGVKGAVNLEVDPLATGVVGQCLEIMSDSRGWSRDGLGGG